MKRGRKAGSSDFVYVTRELILKAADALAGHRRDKQVPISKAWLESSGYDLVPVAEELVEGEKKAEEAEEKRKNSSRLDNVATVQPKLTAGQQSGPTDVFVPWKSIQHLFKDQELYEDAFKIFGKILGVSDWKKLPLKGIRGDVIDALFWIDQLREIVESNDTSFAEMRSNTATADVKLRQDLKSVPVRYLRAFLEATEGMAPDLPLEDVRRYLGKRKRVSEVPCKNVPFQVTK